MDQIRFNDPSLVRFRLDRNLLSLDLEKTGSSGIRLFHPSQSPSAHPKQLVGIRPSESEWIEWNNIVVFNGTHHYSTFFIHILPQKIGKFHSTGGGNCTMTKSGEKYTTENGVARQDGFKDGGWLKRTN
jgi:hypothetical protein